MNVTDDVERAPDTGGPVDADVALISDYLAHELTLKQMLAVEGRLQRDAGFRHRVQAIIDGWSLATDFSAEFGISSEASRDPVATPGELSDGWERYRSGRAAPKPTEKNSAWHGVAWRIAASIAALLLVGALVIHRTDLLYGLEGPQAETTGDRMRALFDRTSLSSDPRQTQRTTLANGSSVTLTPGSEVVVRPAGRGADSTGRGLVMSLRGEAVIEVSRRTGTIYLGTAAARAVLSPGRYLIRSARNDSMIAVRVEDGVMTVTPREATTAQEVRAGSAAQIRRDGAASVSAISPGGGDPAGDGAATAQLLAPAATEIPAQRPAAVVSAPLAGVVIDTLPGGIVRITSNGPNEWQGTGGWRLAIERTIRMDEQTTDPIGEVRSIALHPDGRVVVAEGKPVRIRLFTPGKADPVTLAREGEGPGEVRTPYIALQGDTLLIKGPSRFTAMLLSGKVLFSFAMRLNGQDAQSPRFDPSGRVLVSSSARRTGMGVTEENRFTPIWIRFDRGGRVIDTLFLPPELPMPWWKVKNSPNNNRFSVPLSPESGSLLLRSGQVLLGQTDRNDFSITRTGKDTARIFRRTDRRRITVSDFERDSIFKWYDEARPGMGDKSDIPAQWPLWRWTAEDGSGNIWVRHDRDPLFDVYAPNGILRGSVMAPPINSRASWAGDRVATAGTDGDGFPYIAIFRIERKKQ